MFESRSLPSNEKYGLISQIRRSAVSIPSNIAEGSSRTSKKDFARFIEISIGSAFELETQLLIAIDTEMIVKDKIQPIIEELIEIQRMSNSYRINVLNSI